MASIATDIMLHPLLYSSSISLIMFMADNSVGLHLYPTFNTNMRLQQSDLHKSSG